MLPPIATIIDNFGILDEGPDQIEYLIELGRALPPFPEDLLTEANRVHGCESQVWVASHMDAAHEPPRLSLRGTSDSTVTKGLIALVMALHDGKTPQEIAAVDVFAVFREIGLGAHLTSKRSNGVRAMAERIHRDAARLLAA
ncbi:Cysteine desulfuration protein SufE [Methylobacterium adhaesivum]|jgi:cysteine desulfuration protein SufE|uniref:SufE family protein n=1 Tax=Methylobacterium adhaesivum TaxID=333297 RepID=A0ABT8BPV0_9HYPH|nr:SufE family protein [Methylobacterium adhaesivum]MDN3593214.1 SufE family protein [Methylobacterium adhaesivum]GJD33027.1 Cysteine desulfuration protein SufE [Methylobacterium adhaesivum]